MSLNFNVYKGRELQHFLAMLNQCETAGVTDIRFIRERLQNHINTTFNTGRVRRFGKPASMGTSQFKTCPSCEKGLLMPVINREGLNIVGCKRCRHSEVIS